MMKTSAASASTGPQRRLRPAATSEQAHLGVLAAYAAAALGLAAFALQIASPRDAEVRARDSIWLASGVCSWLSILAAVVFLVGLRAAAQRVPRAGEVALVTAVVATSAGAAIHARVLVDYTAFGINPGFATTLHDTQSTPAEIIFALLALAALCGWLGVAVWVAPEAGLAVPGRVAVAVAGLGVMLPAPVTALALLPAGLVLSAALRRSERADSAAAAAISAGSGRPTTSSA